MKYIFRGRLCGRFCHDCHEPLAGIKLRIYQAIQRKDLALLAVADPSQTFHEVNADEEKGKNKLLIAETVLDANGNFSFTIDEQSGYKGEAFDVDFVCGTGYGKPRPPKKEEFFQFHITTLQPQWRESGVDKERVYQFGWEYCIPAKWWCRILQKIDRWVICGRVTDCETDRPAGGVRVFAFDVDLIEDDPLGSAYTDSNGYFRIFYTSADFSKTIFSWLNVEWPAGPDLYFRIESASGQVLLNEPRHTGHRHDRTNAHNCFCIKLCVKYDTPIDFPWFTHVGNYNITTDINPSGLTIHNRSFASGVGFGFFSAIKLSGFATKKVPTDLSKALFYRFMFSFDGTNWNPVTETQSYHQRLKVGVRQIIWGGTTAFQDIVIDPTQPASVPDSIPPDNSPNPMPDHVLRQDANGWIRVDQVGLDNGFYGPLLWVNTNTIVPGGNAQDPGDVAGNNPVNPKNGKKVFFAFQTTDDPSNPGSPDFREQSIKGVTYINNWSEVRLLTLDELTAGGAGGCNPITTHAHVHYTADHELIAGWSLYASSAALPGGITILSPGSSGTVPRGHADNIDLASPGTVNPAFNLWPSCAYRLGLSTRRKLTDGEDNDLGSLTELIFCR
ncbi:MAG: hypothetical protein Q8941_01370 [Bacteroidota bacterium]|nr:hypothetical protein [Bacteroidota bacterium]